MTGSDTAYRRALSSLATTGPFDGDATDEYIAGIMGDLGITDAHVYADWAASAPSRLRDMFGFLTDETWTSIEVRTAKRNLLCKVQSWLGVDTSNNTAFAHLLLDDPNPYNDMTPADVLWWDAAFAHFGMNGDKVHSEAEDWWGSAPADGWLAYAAGLSLDEYAAASQRPERGTLLTLVALRATTADPGLDHALGAARRIAAALRAFAAHGGDPDGIGVRP